MRKPKSKLLSFLLRHVTFAKFSNEHPELKVEDLIELKRSYDPSRRKFAGDVAKLGLLAGLVGTSAFRSDTKIKTPFSTFLDGYENGNAKTKKIAVIGGGIAGLHAAYLLSKAGLKCTLYEGSHRLGGRILTHYNNALDMDIHPEFGGDFIDSSHEDMINLAREFNLELIDLYDESASAGLLHETFYFEGHHLTEKEIITAFKDIISTLEKDIESLGPDYDTPAALLLDKMTLKDYIQNLPCVSWLKELLTAAFIAEYGLDPSDQSAINMLDMISTDTTDGFKVFGDSDERYRIKGGNSKLIQHLAEELEESIVLGAMLTAISKRDGSYVLSFKDKVEVIADYVIITIPFTLLKDVHIDLPEMTTVKRNAIDELGYGHGNKLFLGYKSRPWRENENKYYGYLFHKDIHNGWDSSTTKFSNNEKGAYCCYLGGNESIRLSAVAIVNDRTPKSHTWRTDLEDHEIEKYVDEMDRVFPGSKKAYAKKHAFACWTTYPYAKACYTCPKPGQWNGALLHTMEPVGDVYFAGEHCSTDFQGFMNGAAETGRVAAEKIMEKITRN
jgi:monoamine oxidase